VKFSVIRRCRRYSSAVVVGVAAVVRASVLIAVGGLCAVGALAAEPLHIHAHTTEAAKPWTGLTANDAPEDFNFVVVTDRTGDHRPGVFESAMPKVNGLQPAFVVSVGDLIEGYTNDQELLNAQWDEFEGFVGQLNIPFFYTPGNHDMSNAMMSETWRRRFGPSYYHFIYKDVLFLVINSELFGMVGDPGTPVPGPWQPSEQLRYIKHVLSEHEDARWTFVLTHQPLWDREEDRGWDTEQDREGSEVGTDWLQVEKLLGERNYTVFAGHTHRYKKTVRHQRNYITLATTGGASPLRGPLFGEFDHVALVHMSGAGPTITNLVLDGILPDDVATENSQRALRNMAHAVQLEPEYLEATRFETGQVNYRITNSGDAPLKAVASVMNNDVLHLSEEPMPIVVAPGKQARLTLNLAATRKLGFEELPPARITWLLVSQIGQQQVAMELETALLPQRQFDVARVRQAIHVDGDLSEWDLPYSVTRQGDITSPQVDPADISFSFGLGYDAENLYLAAQVVDDSIVASSDRTALEQDGLVVAVDARPDPQRSANELLDAAVETGNFAQMAVELMTLEPAKPTAVLGFLNEVRAEFPNATRRTATGYAAEMAIPIAMLNRRQGRDWDAIRLSIYANDFDAGKRGSKTLHWQPDRFGAAPIVGTGTFLRQ
jgi:hypothetical protein